MRRQAAEMAAINIENEGKVVEVSHAYEEVITENEKLRRQLAALNDNLWGMLRVNRELRAKRGPGAYESVSPNRVLSPQRGRLSLGR